MGLIKAALGAAGGVMADQWKEYFYCESIPENVMAVRDSGAFPDAAATQREAKTSSRTAPSLRWRTDSV